MTKKLSKQEIYTELSVQLARVEAKLDKVFDLLQEKDKTPTLSDITIGYTGCSRCNKWECMGNCSTAKPSYKPSGDTNL